MKNENSTMFNDFFVLVPHCLCWNFYLFFDKWEGYIEVSYFICIWIGIISDILYFFFEHPILLFLFGTVGFIIFFSNNCIFGVVLFTIV